MCHLGSFNRSVQLRTLRRQDKQPVSSSSGTPPQSQRRIPILHPPVAPSLKRHPCSKVSRNSFAVIAVALERTSRTSHFEITSLALNCLNEIPGKGLTSSVSTSTRSPGLGHIIIGFTYPIRPLNFPWPRSPSSPHQLPLRFRSGCGKPTSCLDPKVPPTYPSPSGIPPSGLSPLYSSRTTGLPYLEDVSTPP